MMTRCWVYISKLTIRQLERLLTGPDVFYMRTSFSDIIPVNIGNSGCPNFSMPLNSSTNPSPLNSCEITQPSKSCLGASLLSLFPPASESRGDSTLQFLRHLRPLHFRLLLKPSLLCASSWLPSKLHYILDFPVCTSCKTRTPFRLGFRPFR